MNASGEALLDLEESAPEAPNPEPMNSWPPDPEP